MKKLQVSKHDLQLIPTLGGGQSFRWKTTDFGDWVGVFRSKVWMLSQTDDHLLYKCLSRDDENSLISEEEELKSYFRLNVDLSKYYEIWSERDPNFKKSTPQLYGIRILNQEVTENLFSFICSSNNNIKRISLMVEKLCQSYGEQIAEIDNQMFYSFPSVEKLTSDSVQSDLRQAGFGYRAKFIYESACKIEKLGGNFWLENLKQLPYEVARKELMKLPGIGAKVADCICLMSLGHLEAVPVDTHIFQVAASTYLPHLKKHKSVTEKVYNEIGDYFRSLHGEYAGWANTILFCSDLKLFQMKKEKKDAGQEKRIK